MACCSANRRWCDLVSGLAAAKNYRQMSIRKGAAHVGSAWMTRATQPRWDLQPPNHHPCLGKDLAGELMGLFFQVSFVSSRSGWSACADRHRASSGCSRPPWSRWRPRVHPVGHRSAPDLLQRPGVGAGRDPAAGLLGGGSRFLGVTEDTAGSGHRPGGPVRTVSPPTNPGGTGWRRRCWPSHREGTARAGARAGAPGPQTEDPRTPVLLRIAHEKAAMGRTSSCSPRSDGSARRSSAVGCRSTVPARVAPCSPTWACPSSCCAASRYWHEQPGCSAPRRGAPNAHRHTRCTPASTGARGTSPPHAQPTQCAPEETGASAPTDLP